jgi:hypothetical protein
MFALSFVAGAEREDSGGCPTSEVGWALVIQPCRSRSSSVVSLKLMFDISIHPFPLTMIHVLSHPRQNSPCTLWLHLVPHGDNA